MAQQIDYFGSTLQYVCTKTHLTNVPDPLVSRSQTNGANNYATVTFRGNAIDVYGGTAPDHGLFTVSLDNEPAQTFNGTAHVQRSKVLLVRSKCALTTIFLPLTDLTTVSRKRAVEWPT